MADWAKCRTVEQNPHKISGNWVFTGTRVPVYALFENLESSAKVNEFLAWYSEVKAWQVASLPKHEVEYFKSVIRNEDSNYW